MAKQLDRERRDRAREQLPAEKFLAGGELFEDACQITLAGIRNVHPEWPENRVLKELRQRLAMQESREAVG